MIEPQAILNIHLISAASQGKPRLVRKLLSEGADPQAHESKALLEAILSESLATIKILLPLSDARAQDSLALRFAAMLGSAAAVRLLIPHCDPHANNSRALWIAANNGHARCVAPLLLVSDPLAVGEGGQTPAMAAVSQGHPLVSDMIQSFCSAREAKALSQSTPRKKRAPASSRASRL